ncbi:MAG: DinB family protein [Bacteroidota bacterium]
MSIVRGDPLSFPRLEDFPDMTALKQYAQTYHKEASDFLRHASTTELERIVMIPWFKDPAISITVAQALTQAAMHSQYHRGQNASRLRELGGAPPLTDFIAWYWKGRPEPRWE